MRLIRWKENTKISYRFRTTLVVSIATVSSRLLLSCSWALLIIFISSGYSATSVNNCLHCTHSFITFVSLLHVPIFKSCQYILSAWKCISAPSIKTSFASAKTRYDDRRPICLCSEHNTSSNMLCTLWCQHYPSSRANDQEKGLVLHSNDCRRIQFVTPLKKKDPPPFKHNQLKT